MHGESDGVDVRAVIRDDGESEDDETEFSKSSQVVDEDSAEKSACSGGLVADIIAVICREFGRSSAHDGNSEHFCKQQRNYQSEPCPEEYFSPGLRRGLIDGVIRSIRSPTRRETIHDSSEGENISHFRFSCLPGDVYEISTVREDAQCDEKNYKRGNPRPEFICVNNFVSKCTHPKCTNRNNQNPCETRYVLIYRMQ